METGKRTRQNEYVPLSKFAEHVNWECCHTPWMDASRWPEYTYLPAFCQVSLTVRRYLIILLVCLTQKTYLLGPEFMSPC